MITQVERQFRSGSSKLSMSDSISERKFVHLAEILFRNYFGHGGNICLRRGHLHEAHGSPGSSWLPPKGRLVQSSSCHPCNACDMDPLYLVKGNISRKITRFPAALNEANAIRGLSL